MGAWIELHWVDVLHVGPRALCVVHSKTLCEVGSSRLFSLQSIYIKICLSVKAVKHENLPFKSIVGDFSIVGEQIVKLEANFHR